MAKSTKIIAALGVVAGLGVAAMPLASYAADVTEITDTVEVVVTSKCTFQDDGEGATAANDTFSKNINNNDNATIGTRNFNVYCNDHSGYQVTAKASNLTNASLSTEIPYVSASSFSTAEAAQGQWTAAVTVTPTTDYTAPNEISTAAEAPVIVKNTKATATAGVKFSVEYKAYVGTDTEAGAYSGTVVYTLSHPAA